MNFLGLLLGLSSRLREDEVSMALDDGLRRGGGAATIPSSSFLVVLDDVPSVYVPSRRREDERSVMDLLDEDLGRGGGGASIS